ncbi:MAG: hypothetical protein IPM66_24935 [Acidobacteriota bacterium]|nr:MAG: hypothetical protein IPM66_24935 [Acidobacteriota bacterium]
MIRPECALLLLALAFTQAARTRLETEPGIPLIYWTAGIETAASLKATGIDRIAVPADQAPAWRESGLRVIPILPGELARRTKLAVPRIAGRSNVASATRRPWIDANGWNFIRHPSGSFLYELPQGRALLAAAEAHAYAADALLEIDPADVGNAGRMLAFLKNLPRISLPPVADIGLIDDGSEEIDEIANLLVRRNLLFDLVKAPSKRYRLSVRLGTGNFPKSAASDPNRFAQIVRSKLGDENRSLRLYGTETVLCRLVGDAAKSRLLLINYAGRDADSLRIRVRGTFRNIRIHAFGIENAAIEDLLHAEGSTEFSISRLGWYAVVDLNGK